LKKIIYYITDHGKGHATRSVAIIKKLKKNNFDVTIRNSNATEMLKHEISECKIIDGLTDVGPIIKKNGFSIDEKKSIEHIIDWINKIDKIGSREIEIFSKIKPDLVISDISPMPLYAAKKVEIPSIAISNFSWYDVLKFLPKSYLEKLKIFYDNADLAIKLPLGTEMRHFQKRKTVGLISRKTTKTKEQIRKELGIKKDSKVVLFALSGSDHVIQSRKGNNVEYISLNTKINSKLKPINLDQVMDGQNYVLASDLVIGKCGYGLISECLNNEVPFFYVADESHLEQMGIETDLIKRGIRNRKTLEEMDRITYDHDFLNSLKKPLKEKNDIDSIVSNINEFLK
jgi:UDP:flavonoid glycosyltransferase YjiC (YdhE family)